MEEKRSFNKSLMVVSLLLLSVVAVLIVLFVLRPTEERDGIVLPGVYTENPSTVVETVLPADEFLQVDRNNVTDALRAMDQPEYYHQTYQIQFGSGRSMLEKVVDIWVNGTWIHAEVHDDFGTKSVFTDGNTAWIWYNQDINPISVQLDETLLLEDLIGIPNFDYLTYISKADRLECGYGFREDDLLQYLFVNLWNSKNETSEYWFSLSSGLMYSCQTIEFGQQVYAVTQVAFERLALGDQAFQGRFCLPDGTVPFPTEKRMLQP